MLSDAKPQVFHDFLTRLCAADYLFGLAWHGTLDIPSQTESKQHHFTAVVSDQFDIQSIRNEIATFRQEQDLATSESTLTILNQKSAARFFMLHPELAERIESYGWQSRLGWLGMIRSAGEQRSLNGWMGQQLIQISTDLLKPPRQLDRLNALTGSQLKDTSDDPIKIYAQSLASQTFGSLGADTEKSEIPPFNFPAPVAIYRKLSHIVLVTHEPAETLSNWNHEAFNSYAEQFEATGAEVCTPEQLLTVAQQYGGLDVRLRRYHHIWGERLLDSLSFSQRELLTNAAENSARLQIEWIGRRLFRDLPDPSKDRLLIHDLQNQLLNIRLQNEILGGLNILPKGKPESNLPDKALPIEDRLKIIIDLFDWWGDFYFAHSRASQN